MIDDAIEHVLEPKQWNALFQRKSRLGIIPPFAEELQEAFLLVINLSER